MANHFVSFLAAGLVLTFTPAAAAGDSCVHDECDVGGPLSAECSPCAQAVCDEDTYCCDEDWDVICVELAEELCGGCGNSGNSGTSGAGEGGGASDDGFDSGDSASASGDDGWDDDGGGTDDGRDDDGGGTDDGRDDDDGGGTDDGDDDKNDAVQSGPGEPVGQADGGGCTVGGERGRGLMGLMLLALVGSVRRSRSRRR